MGEHIRDESFLFNIESPASKKDAGFFRSALSIFIFFTQVLGGGWSIIFYKEGVLRLLTRIIKRPKGIGTYRGSSNVYFSGVLVMRKRFIAAMVMIMILVFPGIANASEIYIDGKNIQSAVEPVMVKGRLLVPFRDIFQALGAAVDWDEETGKVTAYKGSTTIEMTAGGVTFKNGKTISLDVPPRIIKGRTMVPVRFVSETMGAQVNWDIATQSVSIITGATHPITYTWEYGGYEYTFGPLDLTEYEYQSILNYYRSKPHPSLLYNNSLLSTYTYSYDPEGEEVLLSLVNRLEEFARESGITGDGVAKFVVAFVQSFPYVNDSVSTPYDDYTRYPIETLIEREGDCEDTALLTAVLLKELGYGSAFLIMPEEGHAAVGVLGGGGMYGSYFEVDGRKYFYLETTATGWEIGDIPEELSHARAIVVPL